MASDDDWFDEIDLDPTHSSIAMGTRALGHRPWLVIDTQRDAELALKAHLCTERHAEVFAALPATEDAGAAVEDLVRSGLADAAGRGPITARGSTPKPTTSARPKSGDLGLAEGPRSPDFGVEGIDDGRHPLDRAGRSVQEDLCLLRRRDDGWYLEAASLCFPSRWRLADKIGHHITEVHGPVDGYVTQLASRVDRLLDQLTDRPILRRNWFVHPDPSLFQPAPPTDGDPVIAAADAMATLVVRSERQTLRRLPDEAGGATWVLFTIRVQQSPLESFCSDQDRRRALVVHLREADESVLDHRGIAPAQIDEILAALGASRRLG